MKKFLMNGFSSHRSFSHIVTFHRCYSSKKVFKKIIIYKFKTLQNNPQFFYKLDVKLSA